MLPPLSSEAWSSWHRAWPEQQQDDGRYSWRGTLLIGPGGRWRLEGSVPGRDAGGGAAEGNDGERGWSWRPWATGCPPPLPVKVNGAYPPVPELLCPSRLLGGYTLEELGPVTVAGRDAIAVVATPRRDVLGSGPGRSFATACLTTASRSPWTRSSASCSAGSRRPGASWSPSPS